MRRTPLLVAFVLLAAGASVLTAGARAKTTIPPVPHVDLPRFMGDWYVIAHIPTFVEKDAYDAIESYALRDDGKVQTTYRQRKGGFDAPVKIMRPVGTVRPGTGNAIWGMQFVWPIKAEYVIAYVDDDYTRTIIARSDLDHAWIMARTPSIPDDEYLALVERLRALGYDISKLRRVPHRAMRP